MLRTTIILLAALTSCACFDSDDVRTPLVELQCVSRGDCVARWDGEDLWSRVVLSEDLFDLTDVDPSSVWDCDPDPDVDVCVEVDGNGHVGCFRIESTWAVAVAPTCAVSGDDWIPVGIGMAAQAESL